MSLTIDANRAVTVVRAARRVAWLVLAIALLPTSAVAQDMAEPETLPPGTYEPKAGDDVDDSGGPLICAELDPVTVYANASAGPGVFRLAAFTVKNEGPCTILVYVEVSGGGRREPQRLGEVMGFSATRFRANVPSGREVRVQCRGDVAGCRFSVGPVTLYTREGQLVSGNAADTVTRFMPKCFPCELMTCGSEPTVDVYRNQLLGADLTLTTTVDGACSVNFFLTVPRGDRVEVKDLFTLRPGARDTRTIRLPSRSTLSSRCTGGQGACVYFVSQVSP